MHLRSVARLRVAAPILLSLLFAAETFANGRSVFDANSPGSTFEVAVQEVVTREISDEVVVREIAPQEFARKRNARKEATSQLTTGQPTTNEPAPNLEPVAGIEVSDVSTFLDRLMAAESGGRDNAANPLSTALGPFQFIKSTFLDVARRHFPEQCTDLTDEQVLALRTQRHFARSAARAYTLENAAHLKAQGHEPTWAHLRLAFLLGPTGATRVLDATANTPLSQVLSASVLQANPFMLRMTATELVARAERDVSSDRHIVAARERPTPLARPEAQARPAARGRPGTPDAPDKAAGSSVASIKIRCNQKLVSCQRWVALQKQKKQKTRNAEGASARGGKS